VNNNVLLYRMFETIHLTVRPINLLQRQKHFLLKLADSSASFPWHQPFLKVLGEVMLPEQGQQLRAYPEIFQL